MTAGTPQYLWLQNDFLPCWVCGLGLTDQYPVSADIADFSFSYS